MKTVLRIKTIQRNNNLVVKEDIMKFDSMEDALRIVSSLDKEFMKEYHRFSYDLTEVEEAE